MRRNSIRGLTIVALLLMTISIRAGQMVTVKVLPDKNAGTIECSVSEGICSLTATPAQGYFLTAENLSAVATISGENLQAPKRSLPINDGVLKITPTDANTDSTGVSKYTFNIPEGCNVEVTANFQAIPYPITVNGVGITGANCGDVFGDKKVSFDRTLNILTLNSVNFENGVVVHEGCSSLVVRLEGENTINGNGFSFAVSPAYLTFATNESSPGSLSVSGTLASTSVAQGTVQLIYENGLLYHETANAKTVSISRYDLTVGGVAVSSVNASKITGDNMSGSISFDAESNTLTLNNATIDMTQTDGYPIEGAIADLKVLLIGENTLKTNAGKSYGFHSSSNTGALTFTHEKVASAKGYGSLEIFGGLADGYIVQNTFGASGWQKTEGETITISYADYYLSVGNVEITSANLTLSDGKLVFNPATMTLSLNNFTTTADISSGLVNMTILLTGVNSVGAITGPEAGDTLVVLKNEESNELLNELTVTSISGYQTVTVDEPLKRYSEDDKTVISDVRKYSLWVKGTQVTSKNQDAVAAGVSFDGDHTLQLSSIDITSDKAPFITNGLSKLTIHLMGQNAVNCGQQPFLTKFIGDNDHQVTFTTDPSHSGKLTVTVAASNSWYTGHSAPTFLNKLEERSSVEGTVKTVTVEAPSTYYNLTIDNVDVTNLNAKDVLGDAKVSFNATTNTLSLNGATINGNITSGIQTLIVNLKGENTLSGQFVKSGNGADLIFETQDTSSKLTMGGAIDGLTAVYRSKLELSDNVIALPEFYGISVGGIDIKPSNRFDVLNDGGSVKFNNNSMLLLDNATITGEIVIADAGNHPNDSLTIYLKGSNTIILREGEKAVRCENGTLKLAFIIDAEKTGKLLVEAFDSNVEETDLFTGVTLSYDGLCLKSNAETQQLEIVPYLSPVVNNEGDTNETNFSNEMNSSTDTSNNTVNGVLYTMGGDQTDQENTGGYDQTQNALVFVAGAAMTEEGLEDLLDEQPGTEAYADKFTGLTFVLPAGTSILEIQSYIVDPEYAFYVQVDNQEPVEIESGFSNTMMALTQLKVALSQAQTVKLFMMKKVDKSDTQNQEPGAPQMINRRIGPKSSIAGGLGGISIHSNNVQVSEPAADTHKMMEKSALASSIAAIINAGDGFTCNDEEITSLPDNMFMSNDAPTAAPLRRAGGTISGTILPEGLTFVDFSNTKITDMEVSRTSGAFNGVPENVFIYVPAGNTTKEKNVVIGGICDRMELNGEADAKPFKALKNFTVGQAVLKRSFEASANNPKTTIYLPYSLSQEDADSLGVFYEYEGHDDTTVNMKSVKSGGLKANKPYIFQVKEGGVENPLVRVVSVLSSPAETEGFKGVFERKDYEYGMYDFVVQTDDNQTKSLFVEMESGSWVPPFRAYLRGEGTASYAIAWDGVIDSTGGEELPTIIETTKVVADKKTAEGWWTLSGVSLSSKPKKAGLYINNGKMVIVK